MVDKKILVVYYSRSGNTKKVMESLGAELECDIEKLIDLKDRSGLLGYISSAIDTLKKKDARIKPVQSNPADYDLVIIGSPTWVSTMANAVRTYLKKYQDCFDEVAFVTTQGASNTKIFDRMSKLAQKEPIAQLDILEKDLDSEICKNKMDEFVSQIKTK